MTSSISSKTSHVSDRRQKKKSKVGNRTHAQPAEKVRSGRVSKRHHKAASSQASTPENLNTTTDVRQETQNEFSSYENISSDEGDAYEDAGTDKDCSEGSGSATEKDTPTRLALERRKEAKKKRRDKIALRRIGSPRNTLRPIPSAPSSHRSSSIGRSSPCDRRTPSINRPRYSSARPSSPPPSDAQSTQAGESMDSVNGDPAGPEDERV